MEISKELKDTIMNEVRKMLPQAEEMMLEKQFTTKYVDVPIPIDGVMDIIRYNVEEKRFDSGTIQVATEGINSHSSLMTKTGCYCDKVKYVNINIEKGDS